MRIVQSRDIQSFFNHGLYHFIIITRRSDCGYDSGSTHVYPISFYVSIPRNNEKLIHFEHKGQAWPSSEFEYGARCSGT